MKERSMIILLIDYLRLIIPLHEAQKKSLIETLFLCLLYSFYKAPQQGLEADQGAVPLSLYRARAYSRLPANECIFTPIF